MVSKAFSMGLFGMHAFKVEVECDLSAGLPAFDLVGLPDAAVKESRNRVRAALKNCGFDFPVSRITRSRLTFAKIDAAAMLGLFASPLTMVSPGTGMGGIRLPSMST